MGEFCNLKYSDNIIYIEYVVGGIYMSCVKVVGKKCIGGTVCAQGCKNSVLPIIAATLLNGGQNIIHNCPCLSDVYAAIDILRALGVNVVFSGNTLIINSEGINSDTIRPDLMKAMRSSVIFLGPMLSRLGEAVISMPGGCDIGKRPIDIHLMAFSKMGISVVCEDGNIRCIKDRLRGEKIFLPKPSVGATENIMLLACKGSGVTTIINAAREPEIIDLQNFLNSMGARIFGAGTSEITIYSVNNLDNSEYTVMPDRIEAATYCCAVAACGGYAEIKNIVPEHIESVLSILEKSGSSVVRYPSSVYISSGNVPQCVSYVSTGPYPAFPTDVQSIIMSVMSLSSGEGVIVENIFENRFGHAQQLKKMGADIKVSDKKAFIRGKKLYGAEVSACDLRSGAALIVAALGSCGETIISNCQYIDRGYEDFEDKFKSLGVDIERMD